MPTPSTKSDPRERSRLAIAKRMAEVAKVPPAVSAPPPPPPVPKDAPNGHTGAPTGGLVDIPIELLVNVRAEPEKSGVGYSFFSAGLSAERGLTIVLNSDKLLVSRALAKADVITTSFLYGLLLSENLALRSSESPLVRALQQAIAKELYPQSMARSQVFCDFAFRLSLSPILQNLKQLPIYGPSPLDKPYAVATVAIQVSPEVEQTAKWKRLSRKWRNATSKANL
jgi:hypothetical protein